MAQETMESLGAKRGRRQTEAKKKEDIPPRHPVDVANGKRRGEPIVRRAEEAAQRREGTENGLPKIPGRRQENDQAAQRREGANRRENQLQQLSGNNLSYYNNLLNAFQSNRSSWKLQYATRRSTKF